MRTRRTMCKSRDNVNILKLDRKLRKTLETFVEIFDYWEFLLKTRVQVYWNNKY